VATAEEGHAAATARAQALARQVHGGGPAGHPEPEYGGLVTRGIAFAIDAAIIDGVAIVVGAVGALIVSLLPGTDGHKVAAVAAGGAVFLLWSMGYFIAFWTATGQTPGNRVMQIRVERLDGRRLRFRHALVRLLGIALSAPLMLGFLPILVTARRRGLHDWLAGTVVVVVPSASDSGPQPAPNGRRPPPAEPPRPGSSP
jgi:uncharacterized RDD family membrane protein YckC